MATPKLETLTADQPVKISVDDQGRVFTTTEELQKVRDGWALAIGRFIVAFTGCEYWTYQYAKTFGTAAQMNGDRP